MWRTLKFISFHSLKAMNQIELNRIFQPFIVWQRSASSMRSLPVQCILRLGMWNIFTILFVFLSMTCSLAEWRLLLRIPTAQSENKDDLSWFQHSLTKLLGKPPKSLVFWVGDETGLLLQQLNGESVSYHHEHHWNVECKQWTKYEECAIIDDTLIRFWHDILMIYNSCRGGRPSFVTNWINLPIILVTRILSHLT